MVMLAGLGRRRLSKPPQVQETAQPDSTSRMTKTTNWARCGAIQMVLSCSITASATPVRNMRMGELCHAGKKPRHYAIEQRP